MKESELVVESWPVKDLKPYKNNVKIHTKEQIDILSQIIKREGFSNPIVIDEKGVIICGHGRHLAVKKLGYKKVAVFVRRGFTDKENDSKRIQDNKIAEGEVDQDGMIAEMARLASEPGDSLDNVSFGMSDAEYGDMLSEMASNVSSEDIDNLFGGDDDSLSSVFDDTSDRVEKPASKEVEYKPFFEVTVECKDEDEQREIYEVMTEAGHKCKVRTM